MTLTRMQNLGKEAKAYSTKEGHDAQSRFHALDEKAWGFIDRAKSPERKEALRDAYLKGLYS